MPDTYKIIITTLFLVTLASFVIVTARERREEAEEAAIKAGLRRRRPPRLSAWSSVSHLWSNAQQDLVISSLLSKHREAGSRGDAGPRSPARLLDSLPSIVLGFVLVLAKHVPFLGTAPRLADVDRDGTIKLPSLSYTSSLEVEEDEVDAYHRIVTSDTPISQGGTGITPQAGQKGQQPSSERTATPLLILAPLTTPMLVSLIMKRSSPIKPLGSVNVRNTFIFHDPAACTSSARDGLRAVARMGGELRGRRVKRGVEYDSVIEVSSGGESSHILSSDTSNRAQTDPGQSKMFEFIFTTLAQVRFPSTAPLYQNPHPVPQLENGSSDEGWFTDPDPLEISDMAPTAWAHLSKDYNPIHTSPLLARAFGFKRKIAHGNLVLALVMQRAITYAASNHGREREEGEGCPAALGKLWAGSGGGGGGGGSDGGGNEPCWLAVEFKRPVFVPGSVGLRWSRSSSGKAGAAGKKMVGRVQVVQSASHAQQASVSQDVKVLLDIRAGHGITPSA